MSEKITRRDFFCNGGKFFGAFALLNYGDLMEKFIPPGSQEVKFSSGAIKKANYFKIMEGNNLNLLYQGEKFSADILLSSKTKKRIIFAFLNGNSCGGFWFDQNTSKENTDLQIEMTGDLKEVVTKKGNTYILLDVKTNKKTLVITDYIIDSVRGARDFCESDNYTEKLNRVLWRKDFVNTDPAINIPPAWVAPKVEIQEKESGETVIKLYRTDLYEKYGVYSKIILPYNTKATLTEEGFIKFTGNKEITFQILARSTFPTLRPFRPEELINKNFLQKIKNPLKLTKDINEEELKGALQEYSKYYGQSLRDLLFLSYREGFLAGSWRFLTYFGRDTMMTIMGLGTILTGEAYEAGMESILERLSPKGKVAHEDNSWWQGEGEKIVEYTKLIKENKKGKAKKILSHIYDRNYDYKMVDDDFMFPVMLGNYLKREDITEKEKHDFIHKINNSKVLNKETDNLISIMRNFNRIIGSVIPYHKIYQKLKAECGDKEFNTDQKKELCGRLIRINKGCPVGDWRDSNAGLGGGVYSGNVNVYLVPASLKAIYSSLIKLDSIKKLTDISGNNNLNYLADILNTFSKEGKSEEFESLIESWNKAGENFKVTLNSEDIRNRLDNFISENEEKDFLLSLPASVNENCTIEEFIKGEKLPEILKEGIEFFALSLDENFNPVEVLNSDISFAFFMDELNKESMGEAIKIASLNYPLGLMTGGGIVTANPSLSKDKNLWKSLDSGGYHGTVVWSWQMLLLIKGLLYQSKKVDNQFKSKLLSLATEMINVSNQIGDISHFELWSIKPDKTSGLFKAVPYGEGSETEANAIQLWSTLSLSMADPFNIF